MEMDAPNVMATIRDFNETEIDLETYLGWLQDVHGNPFIESARVDYSMSDLTGYLASKLGRTDVRFWGIYSEIGEFIGTVKLDPIDFMQGTAWLGIMIGGVSHRGKGYGKAVIQQVVRYAAVTLNLKELLLGVHKDNLPALTLYLKQGFEIIENNDYSFVMKKNLTSPTEL